MQELDECLEHSENSESSVRCCCCCQQRSSGSGSGGGGGVISSSTRVVARAQSLTPSPVCAKCGLQTRRSSVTWGVVKYSESLPLCPQTQESESAFYKFPWRLECTLQFEKHGSSTSFCYSQLIQCSSHNFVLKFL